VLLPLVSPGLVKQRRKKGANGSHIRCSWLNSYHPTILRPENRLHSRRLILYGSSGRARRGPPRRPSHISGINSHGRPLPPLRGSSNHYERHARGEWMGVSTE
jgi:hypothetical protein